MFDGAHDSPRVLPCLCLSILCLQCQYGTIVTSATGVKSCQCQAGWTGAQCSESKTKKCYRGVLDPAHNYCRCDPLWAGEVRVGVECMACELVDMVAHGLACVWLWSL